MTFERVARLATVTSPRLTIFDRVLLTTIVLASVIFGTVHVLEHEKISPIDEYVYIDYLSRVSTDGVIAKGETRAAAREYLSCQGVRGYPQFAGGVCGTDADVEADAEFPYGGLTSADFYSPVYFWVTWAVAQPLVFFGVDLITAGRLVGSLWLAAAGVLLFLTVRRLTEDRLLALASPLLLIGSLPSYWSHTYVSTDATAFLAGAALLAIAVRLDEGSGGRVALPLVAAVVVLAKVQNMAAVAMVALFLVFGAWSRRKTSNSPWWRSAPVFASVVAVVAAIGAQGVWLLFRALFLADGPSADQQVGDLFGVGALVAEVFKILPGVVGTTSGLAQTTSIGAVLAGALALVIVAGAVGLPFAGNRKERSTRLGTSALVASLVSAPVLAVVTVVTVGFYFSLPARYGLSLLPSLILCASLLFARRREGPATLLLLAIGLWSLSLFIPNE